MIIRPTGDGHLLLITQPDHAALAADIVSRWDVNAFAPPAARDAVLLAIKEHDNGWQEVDSQPSVDADAGRPYDFMTTPTSFKREIWPRGVERVARFSPQAAALIAHHALMLHAHRAGTEEWRGFFSTLEALRARLLRACGAEHGAARRAFERNYDLLFLGDLISLTFCNGWAEATNARGYWVELREGDIVVRPDPFAGTVVEFGVPARRLPDRTYVWDADLRQTFRDAPMVMLRGTARGEVPRAPDRQ